MFATVRPQAPLPSALAHTASGPYAQAVLRLQISFPDSYPKLPPLVLFSTDMFHPLITPLTTYMYTTDIQDNGTVSARDEERLPPGGFSLRHGFPEWFGRGRRAWPGSRQASGEQARSPASELASHATSSVYSPESENDNQPSYMRTGKRSVSIYHILKYIRSTFDDEEVLDSVPLEAAGNPGAWHAWRTHQRKLGKLHEDPAAVGSGQDGKVDGGQGASSGEAVNTSVRQPGEWNWDGVWEDRVKKGIAASLSEPVLYGGSGGPDELVRNHRRSNSFRVNG